jgi:hypothetical protein
VLSFVADLLNRITNFKFFPGVPAKSNHHINARKIRGISPSSSAPLVWVGEVESEEATSFEGICVCAKRAADSTKPKKKALKKKSNTNNRQLKTNDSVFVCVVKSHHVLTIVGCKGSRSKNRCEVTSLWKPALKSEIGTISSLKVSCSFVGFFAQISWSKKVGEVF